MYAKAHKPEDKKGFAVFTNTKICKKNHQNRIPRHTNTRRQKENCCVLFFSRKENSDAEQRVYAITSVIISVYPEGTPASVALLKRNKSVVQRKFQHNHIVVKYRIFIFKILCIFCRCTKQQLLTLLVQMNSVYLRVFVCPLFSG